MPLHAYTPGAKLPFGIEPVNPIPVDSWSGPYSGGSTTAAITTALSTIPANLRFLSMEVRILAPDAGNPGQTLAYKYWFRGSTGTLEEFSSGGGGGIVGDYVTTFNGISGAVQGVSAAVAGDGISVSAATGSVTITNIGVTYVSAGSFISVSGNTGTVTITNIGVHSFNGLTGAVSGVTLGGANTFTQLNIFSAGISASGATLGTLVVNEGISASTIYASTGSTFAGPVVFNSGLTASRIDVTGSANVVNNLSIGGTLDVYGNLYVQGTVTTVNETQLLIQDKYLVLGSTLNSDALGASAGVYIGSTTSPIISFIYNDTVKGWESSKSINVASGSTGYYIGETLVLSGNTLGTGVLYSSLTKVGTLVAGTWNASIIGLTYGGTNKDLSAGLCGGIVYKDTTGLEVLSSVGSAGQYLKSNGSAAPSWASFSALTGLTADSVSVTEATTGTFYLPIISGYATSTYTVRADSGMTYDANTNTLSCTQIEAIVDGGTW